VRGEQAVGALDLVALEPFVARAAADVMTPPELGVRKQATLGLENS